MLLLLVLVVVAAEGNTQEIKAIAGQHADVATVAVENSQRANCAQSRRRFTSDGSSVDATDVNVLRSSV